MQRTFYFTGWYERRYLALLRSSLQPGDVYVDVGAHVGIHAQLIAADLMPTGGRVIAFEPFPETVVKLRAMIAANALTNLELAPFALGAEHDFVELHSDPVRFDKADASVRSFYAPGLDSSVVEVVRFDEWTESHPVPRINLIKIDVEGAELAVLEGMVKSIRTYRPRLIGIEIRDYLLSQAGTTEFELRSFLSNLGYSPVETADLEGNFLFAPSAATAR